MKFKFLKLNIIVCAVMILTSIAAEAYPVLSLHTEGKGLFGYNNTQWDRGENESGMGGWIGSCTDPGFSRCRPPRSSSANGDNVTEVTAEQLLDIAQVKIANGSRSGSDVMLVQVAGETQTRRYEVTWSSTPVLNKPTETVGDGQVTDIVVDLTFVTI